LNGVQARMKDDDLYTFLEQTVADHMTRDAKTVSRDVSLRELEGLFERDDFNAYPVEESSQVIGLVSKFDFLARFAFSPANMVPR
jgi:CBS-domain-containing membrane protein